MATSNVITTSNISFSTAGGQNSKNYFATVEGIPIDIALQKASDFLDTMRDPIFSAGMGEPLVDNLAWLVHHTLESAKAIIDSVIDGLNIEDARP